MRFTVPKFIEREPKIIGPLTFKQSIFIGIAGGACLLLYFSLAKKSFFLFIICALFLIGISLALAFLKIEGRSLPVILANFFKFSFSRKFYLWKKKEYPSKLILKKKALKKERRAEEESLLKIVENSKLKKIQSQIETSSR